MRLAADVLQDVFEGLRRNQPGKSFRPGQPLPAGARMPRTPLAARVRILPCTQATRRRPLSVALRNMTASGIVFIDSSYWMDGENFLLQLPHRQADPSRALLCTVTSWQPIATDLFVVSASFIRQVDSHPPTSYPKNRPECHS